MAQLKTTIPVSDPSRGVRALRTELAAAFDRVADSGRYIHGPEHAALEVELAQHLDVAHCLGVANGTDALEIALAAVGCREGDEVVTAANCGGYASAAARRIGLRPRFADLDPHTLCLSAATVDAALSPATRAVVVTHLYGLLADVEAIVERCHAAGIPVVEDCAQAAGARRGGVYAGGFGDAATFSFYPTKNLAALGDGGAIATRDPEIAERVRRLRQYGWDAKYNVSIPGGQNSRLDELQAAVLRVRLPHLDQSNAQRREIVRQYRDALPERAGRLIARSTDDYVAHLAVGVFEDRSRAREAFAAAGVGTDIHYPVADHRQAAWRGDYEGISLPVTEQATDHVLTLPCFPELTAAEVEAVCEVLRAL